MAEDDEDCFPVAVAVRVKPGPQNRCVFHDAMTKQLHVQAQPGQSDTYNYEFIFNESSSQEYVYSESVSHFLTTLFDGYNINVLVYGPTGSGKTHTLVGPEVRSCAMGESELGVIARFARDLFQTLQYDDHTKRKTQVKVSFVDVYNDEIKDLLANDDDELNRPSAHIEDHAIPGTKHWSHSEMVGQTEIECSGVQDILSCLENGLIAHRLGASSAYCDLSQGYHSIFTLTLIQVENGLTKKSWVRFVDLASSDQVQTTSVSSSLHHSAINGLNYGLVTLQQLVTSLGTPDANSRPIYTNSLLTRLLSSAFGGNSVTLFIFCVSAAFEDLEETQDTLNFANKAKNILNRPVPNVRQNDPSDRRDSDGFSLQNGELLRSASAASCGRIPIPSFPTISDTRMSSQPSSFQSPLRRPDGLPPSFNNPSPFVNSGLSPGTPGMYANMLNGNLPPMDPISPPMDPSLNAHLHIPHQAVNPMISYQQYQLQQLQYLQHQQQLLQQQHMYLQNFQPTNPHPNPPYPFSTSPFVPITQRSTPLNVSPLAQRSPLSVQMYLPPTVGTPAAATELSDPIVHLSDPASMPVNIPSEDLCQKPNGGKEESFRRRTPNSDEVKKSGDTLLSAQQKLARIVEVEVEDDTSGTFSHDSKDSLSSASKEDEDVDSEDISDSLDSEDFNSECSEISEIDLVKVEEMQSKFWEETDVLISACENEYFLVQMSEESHNPSESRGSFKDLIDEFGKLEVFDSNNMCTTSTDYLLNEKNGGKKSSGLWSKIKSKGRHFHKLRLSRDGRYPEGPPQSSLDLKRTQMLIEEMKTAIKTKEALIRELTKSNEEAKAAEVKAEKLRTNLMVEFEAINSKLKTTHILISRLEGSDISKEKEYLKEIQSYKTALSEVEQKLAENETHNKTLNDRFSDIEEHEVILEKKRKELSSLIDDFNMMKLQKDRVQEELESLKEVLDQSLKMSQDLEQQRLSIQTEELRVRSLKLELDARQKELDQREHLLARPEATRDSLPRSSGSVAALREISDATIPERDEIEKKICTIKDAERVRDRIAQEKDHLRKVKGSAEEGLCVQAIFDYQSRLTELEEKIMSLDAEQLYRRRCELDVLRMMVDNLITRDTGSAECFLDAAFNEKMTAVFKEMTLEESRLGLAVLFSKYVENRVISDWQDDDIACMDRTIETLRKECKKLVGQKQDMMRKHENDKMNQRREHEIKEHKLQRMLRTESKRATKYKEMVKKERESGGRETRRPRTRSSEDNSATGSEVSAIKEEAIVAFRARYGFSAPKEQATGTKVMGDKKSKKIVINKPSDRTIKHSRSQKR